MVSVCFAATNCLDCQRDLLPSRWDVQLTLTWLHMLPRATVPGYRRSVGRVALRLEAGRATCRSRTAHDASAKRKDSTRMGLVSGPGRLDGAKVRRSKGMACPGAWVSPRRGRVTGPDDLGVKARQMSAIIT